MNMFDLAQNIITIISNQNFVAKTVLIVTSVLYALYALVLARQIYILNNLVRQVNFSPLFKFVALIHAIIAIGLLVFIIRVA